MGEQPQGNPPPEGGQGTGDGPKYVTEDQLNRAISARFGDFQKKLEKGFGETLSGFEKRLGERETTPPGGDGEGGKKPNDAETNGLKRRIAELEATVKTATETATAERQRARDVSLRQKVSDALSSAGVKDAVRMRHAASFLIDGQRSVRFDDDGNAVFKDKDGDVDFDTGFKAWLKSDDAKVYLPPPDSGAGGQGRPRTERTTAPTPTGNSADLDEDAKARNAVAALQKLGLSL